MLRVVAGQNVVRSYSTMFDKSKPKTFRVENIFIHPEYKTKKSMHDIALMKLTKPASLYPTINANSVCLTDQLETVGSTAIVSGWGMTQEKGQGSFNLSSVKVKIKSEV